MNNSKSTSNIITEFQPSLKLAISGLQNYLNSKSLDNFIRLIFHYSLFILIYVGAAELGLKIGTFNNGVTIFWPPGGIALAFVMLGGRRYIPAVFFGALIKGYLIEGASSLFIFGAAFANTLETIAGYYLLTHIAQFNWKLEAVSDYIKLILLGAFIPSIISAVIGCLSLQIGNPFVYKDFLQIAFIWWAADVLGIVFFAVLVFYAFDLVQNQTNKKRSLSLWQWSELTLTWVASIVLGLVVLFGIDLFHINLPFKPEAAWLFLIIIWSGLRCGKLNTMLIQGLFLFMALWSTRNDLGYFSAPIHFEGYANFWALSMLLIIGGCLISIQLKINQQVSEKAKYQANHDALTGLPTRLLFTDRFEQNKVSADRYGFKFPVLFIDLDNFKPVNDKYGHIIGDKLLIEVGKRLQESLRQIDTVARIGGDEFLVLIPQLNDEKDLYQIADNIKKSLNYPFRIKENNIQISASIGISTYPFNGKSLEELLKAADKAMYMVKKQGGNNFSYK